ncbi:hypothetical protein CCACVL1_10934 [Corchorus capsularis]|uniref:Protein kinase domain-containing protein n=1 Tax=Corchorus capsularis TaxID=210143 RepID=A0A1R3INS8_COCAP|nr:hypothetical protein CCACVL1_10934 [Corchorus capsularis]
MKKAAHPSNLQPSWGNQSSSSHHDLPGKFSDKNQHKTRGVRNYFKKLAGVFAILSFGKRKKAVTDHVNKSNSQVKGITFSTSTDRSTGSDFRSSAMLKSFDSYGSSSSASGFIPAPDFSFEDICKATGNFSPANKIGEGGFGTVYKGRLKDGSLVAVKRAKKEKYEQGLSGQFKNEILTLSKIEHLNLVRLYGFLEHKDEQIIVVEYVGNGNLREHLDAVRGNGLEIAERLDIAIDVAHAITYLHTYTGRYPIESNRPVKERVTIRWAMKRLKEGEFVIAMDPRLKRSPASNMVVEKVLKLAHECLAPVRPSRPTMKKCVEVLWGIRKDFKDKVSSSSSSRSHFSDNFPDRDAKTNRDLFGIDENESYGFISA